MVFFSNSFISFAVALLQWPRAVEGLFVYTVMEQMALSQSEVAMQATCSPRPTSK